MAAFFIAPPAKAIKLRGESVSALKAKSLSVIQK
jgi:hypothetical protein